MLVAAITFAAAGSAMLFYDLARTRKGRPIWGGGDALQAYWAAYSALFVLAFAFLVAVIVR